MQFTAPGRGGVVSPRGSGRRAGAARTQVLPHRHGDPNLRAGALVSALVRSRAGSGWKADSCCMRWCCPASRGAGALMRPGEHDRYIPLSPSLRPSRRTRPRTSYFIKSMYVRSKDSRRASAEQRQLRASAHGGNHIANWANWMRQQPQKRFAQPHPCRSTRRTCDGFSTPSRCLCRWASAWTRPTGSRRSRRAVRPPRSASSPAMSCCGSTAWRCGTGSCRSPRRSIARSPRTSSCCAASTRFAPPTSSRSMAGHRRSGPSSCRCPWASA